jgi:hypothetical protein
LRSIVYTTRCTRKAHDRRAPVAEPLAISNVLPSGECQEHVTPTRAHR